jgi:hypothetical protein
MFIIDVFNLHNPSETVKTNRRSIGHNFAHPLTWTLPNANRHPQQPQRYQLLQSQQCQSNPLVVLQATTSSPPLWFQEVNLKMKVELQVFQRVLEVLELLRDLLKSPRLPLKAKRLLELVNLSV